MTPPPNGAPDDSLWTPESGQWLETTTARVAQDGYGWMQAVHWVADGGRYRPRRSHGPAFGESTVRVARELVRFSPCRPGVTHLSQRLSLSERSIQYHLQMLRQAGLLAYVQRGTRVRAQGRRASEFARVIPVEFDRCLGIRVTGTGALRRPVGIAESGRAAIAALGRKAARGGMRRGPRRRPRPGARTPVRGPAATAPPCTPKEVATPGIPPTGSTHLPSEAERAGRTTPARRPARRGPGLLNAVGRRYRLAAELIRQVDWLGRCDTPRIAWVIRHVADAGWTVDEVRAWLHARGEADTVRRPSGLLATLLRGAESVLDTPHKRAAAVADWRDARSATARRHQAWQPEPSPPRSRAVRELVAASLAAAPPAEAGPVPAALPAPRPADGPQVLAPDDAALLRETAWGEFMLGDSALVRSAVRTWGPERAAAVYGEVLVRRVLGLTRATSLLTLAGPRGGRP